jgi:ATP-dependent protease ClpP protease subunit
MKIKTLVNDSTTLISLRGDVDENMLGALDAGLKDAFGSGRKAVVVLTTHGGKTTYGEAIAERLQLASSLLEDLGIIAATFVGSAGVQIFLGLPKEKRFVTQRGTIMIHPHGQYTNQYAEGRIPLPEANRRLVEDEAHVAHARRVEERFLRELGKETGIGTAKLRRMYDTGYYFSAKEAVKIGLASSIVSQ